MAAGTREIVLYHTRGCHLCELAEALVMPLVAQRGWTLTRVDIADCDELVARYGTRIPVVYDAGRAIDLGWPFSVSDVLHLMREGT